MVRLRISTSSRFARRTATCASAASRSIRILDASPAPLSETFRQRISEVNLDVNQSVEPMSDLDLFGKEELLTYPGKAGDCEDRSAVSFARKATCASRVSALRPHPAIAIARLSD
ncbi:transglutaminase-like cysteine peptidase [Pseudaminobacter sp. NGMCC 1.201702]|uniref:transglutaminase-like cysteine peptidase n=1 Tax=Pseudaminobacter sp. NGMCC 1.201702 TaxID=3391825 RepID=UPI0039EFC9E6